MPFVAMNAVTSDYGLPSAYPVGVSGLGIDVPNQETPEERAQRERWQKKHVPPLQIPDVSIMDYPFFRNDIGAVMKRLARKFWLDMKNKPPKMKPYHSPPRQMPGEQRADPGLLFGLNGLGASAADCQRMHDDPAVSYTQYADAGCLSFNPGAGTFVQPLPAMPNTPFAQKVGVVSTAFQSLINPYLQLQAQSAQVKADARAKQQQIQDALRSQSAGDNTNFYLIGGGVLLAGLLVFALARRK